MNHRSIPPRLGHPAISLGTELVTSEPQRRRASASPLARLRRPLTRLPFRAPLGATRVTLAALATGYSPLRRSALLGLANSEVPSACCRTPPAPSLWWSLPRLCNLFHMGIPPRFQIRKRGTVSRPPQGVKFRQSARPAQSEASSYPTLWPHPARASRRTERLPCDRPRLGQPRHRAAWKESP